MPTAEPFDYSALPEFEPMFASLDSFGFVPSGMLMIARAAVEKS
ncbi:MAG: hypothetical protein ACKVT1_02140 [Dehalococcoidia bacterium]